MTVWERFKQRFWRAVLYDEDPWWIYPLIFALCAAFGYADLSGIFHLPG
jgi:hypothetical protein